MTAAGEARIAAAVADRSGDSYEVAERLEEPPDLSRGRWSSREGATENWAGFAPSAR
jgi:hypothetical protein